MASPGGATLENMPIGYRFRPSEEELVGHYLKHRLVGDRSLTQSIAEVDVCKMEPWDLPAFSKVKSDDPEWFFFSPRDLKYTNSNRSNRATESGYWKVTGKCRDIKTRGTNNVIGTKKTLVFYKGRFPRAVKTNWVIHEYHAITVIDSQRNFVLCRLIKKTEKKIEGKSTLTNSQGEPSCHMTSECENQVSADEIPDVYSSPEVDMDSIFQAPEYNFPSIQQEPSCYMTSECENQASSDKIPDVYSSPKVDMDLIFQAPEYDFPFIHQEPSCYMASNRENQASSDRIPDVYSSPEVNMNIIFQAAENDFCFIQQEPSFQYASVPTAYNENENSSRKSVVETTEDVDNIDELLDSIFINENVPFNDEGWHTFVGDLPHQSHQEE